MPKQRQQERDGLVHLDPNKVNRQQIKLGLSKAKLARTAGVARNTVDRARRGDGIYHDTALRISKALGVKDVTELLPSSIDADCTRDADESVVIGEWIREPFPGPPVTASNGLQFRVCDLQHRFVEGRRGRGKWYDFLNLSDRDRKQLRAQLVRHPTVCERIGSHKHIVDNISTLPGSNENTWWVIDRFVPGNTLDEFISSRTCLLKTLPRLMTEIAQGLTALHAAKVVFRELAPSRVIVAEQDGRAVLTDFELAKLTDAPTVSKDWPADPYQAPEVSSGTADERSDLYSWARILLHAAAGELPEKGCEADLLSRVVLPKKVRQVVSQCLSPFPSDRPRDVNAVLSEIRRWK